MLRIVYGISRTNCFDLAKNIPNYCLREADIKKKNLTGQGFGARIELDYRKRLDEIERIEGYFTRAPEGIWCYELEDPVDTRLPVEEQYRVIFETARLTHCNDTLARMYGYRTAEELKGTLLKNIHSFENRFSRIGLMEFIRSGYKIHDVESEEVDPKGLKKFFLNTALGVVEDGKLLRAWGVQKDVTLIRGAELRLKRTLKLESLLSEISRNFLSTDPGNTNQAINVALAQLGKFCNADRAYVFLYTHAGLTISNTHEWCDEGIEPKMHRLQNLSLEEFQNDSLEIIGNRGYMLYNSLDEIPASNESLRKFLSKLSIQSVVVVGLTSQEAELGFIGFDSVKGGKLWTEEDIYVLKLVSDLVVLAFDRKKKESDLNDFYERMNHDLELARLTQRSLVARDFPSSPFYQFESYFRPFEKVGGDIITYIQHETGVLDILFGDVSGHGISSAMVSGMAVLSFRHNAKTGISPAEGIQQFVSDLKPMVVEHHIAAVWARFFPLEKKLVYSYAGHPPILLFRGEEMIELKGMNLPLLIFDSIEYFNESIDLKSGDRIVFYSDGMYEIFNAQGRILDLPGFQAILSEYRNVASLEEYIEQVISDVFKFSEGIFGDDMAMLILDLKG
ncbi:SpoIIE-like protein phosphatase domain protein [Leptospira broomii serovar Hurstbridge str. 5399]|uniref:SpoIIE-like protein phosphatase domain protein n=1 Tax=Leptospira broomii serovar Hurstbridge str. 5399 TaxID=1049789 RepID=T0GBV3_9LEPT|nr:SpoIIE family protein phosphatase [Leptospira broomii]EQA44299.1 SpoIIE-like protein phosphatase domain protein [Leptospira broomii serovar Hurstbridge str. 5399]